MRQFVIGALLLLTLNAQAQIQVQAEVQASARGEVYAYTHWGYDNIKKYVAEIDSAITAKPAPLVEAAPNKCLPVFKNALDKGVFDIRYALGYFDDSQGIDIVWNNQNYGLSPSLDIGIFKSIRHVLTETCENKSQLDLCGFTESGDPDLGKVILQKRITLLGKSVVARISLTQASASESFEDNKNSLAERQKFLTLQSEENYFGGIGIADLVIYNGHSRNGGGPDFNPPILNSLLHTDYDGYYRVKKPGISRVLKMIKENPNKDSVLGFFSCFSKKHFYDDLLKANPKQRLVLSSDVVNYFDSLKGSMGYLEGLLKGTCGQDLADIAKQGDAIKAGFLGFQIK